MNEEHFRFRGQKALSSYLIMFWCTACTYMYNVLTGGREGKSEAEVPGMGKNGEKGGKEAMGNGEK